MSESRPCSEFTQITAPEWSPSTCSTRAPSTSLSTRRHSATPRPRASCSRIGSRRIPTARGRSCTSCTEASAATSTGPSRAASQISRASATSSSSCRTAEASASTPTGGIAGPASKPGWETFHLVELSQILERGLNASDQRAVAGLSMGGFGVMSYAGRRPGFFRAAASFSGVLNTLHPTVAPLFPGLYATWLLQTFVAPLGYDPLALFGDPTAQRAVWAAHNPADLVENLRGTKLFVSCGNGHVGPLDPPGTDPSGLLVQLEGALYLQNQEFIARAASLGLDLTVDLYGAGTHTWPYWARELEKAFPLLMPAIGAA